MSFLTSHLPTGGVGGGRRRRKWYISPLNKALNFLPVTVLKYATSWWIKNSNEDLRKDVTDDIPCCRGNSFTHWTWCSLAFALLLSCYCLCSSASKPFGTNKDATGFFVTNCFPVFPHEYLVAFMNHVAATWPQPHTIRPLSPFTHLGVNCGSRKLQEFYDNRAVNKH